MTASQGRTALREGEAARPPTSTVPCRTGKTKTLRCVVRKSSTMRCPFAAMYTGVYRNRTDRELCSNPPLVLKTRAPTRGANTPNNFPAARCLVLASCPPTALAIQPAFCYRFHYRFEKFSPKESGNAMRKPKLRKKKV